MTSLVKQLEEKLKAEKSLRAFVVLLTDDLPGTQAALEKLAADNEIRNVPLTLIPDSAGPDVYQIDPKAEVTVMMWRGSQVRFNHAFEAGKLNAAGVEAIMADVPKLLSAEGK